ncbi:MAG: hypothetical protein LQ338_006479 [Usnochroma carphineum]|nr:MAG: hypothetical protein LQ338_006479 [Usnochroma carphineum]
MAQESSLHERAGREHSREKAVALDASDPLQQLRSEFIIPTKNDLKRNTLAKKGHSDQNEEAPSIYLCGNSLGLQPRRTPDVVAAHLEAWATKGVLGHFKNHEDSELPAFVHIDEIAAQRTAPIVGASASEVAIMETLTANLHLMMASFYRPTATKYKIILEGKAFPSDHFAVESQTRHHGLDPTDAVVLIEPTDRRRATITTSQIMTVIDEHASATALILLPGVQYYTGQHLDISTITAHAHSHGIIIGWDLAHAVGNVELHLHDWDVDFAVWCSYKYLNGGPGAIAGLFVHGKHGQVDKTGMGGGKVEYRHRLSGWWGGDKATRFQMGNQFVPIPGAAGFQVGNPSALAICPLLASLEVFGLTSMSAIRKKSIELTSYLEELLRRSDSEGATDGTTQLYRIITPANPAERGAQLSILLKPGLLEGVMTDLEDQGVVVDERKPDVIRVAPAPLYNSFRDVWDFVNIFRLACIKVEKGAVQHGEGSAALGGTDDKGWSQIK